MALLIGDPGSNGVLAGFFQGLIQGSFVTGFFQGPTQGSFVVQAALGLRVDNSGFR